MRVLTIWMLSAIFVLAACNLPNVPSQKEDTSEKIGQTTVVQVEITPSATAPISPLPTPTIPQAATPTSSVGTSVGRQAEGKDRTPDGFTESIGDAALIFQRSGGFAGVFERWTIYPDGRVIASEGHEWQVEPEQVQQLLSDVETLGFFEMNETYLPDNTCCDRFTYEITIRNGDRVHTVITIDAAPNAPPALWQTIDAIGRLIMGRTE